MISDERVSRLMQRCIDELELDLGGLTVFTEAATGPYLHTPILAALAGAERVFALAADTSYGSKEAIAATTGEAAAAHRVSDRVEVVYRKTNENLGVSDIVTNTAAVRPIDAVTVGLMKQTAVVPLMWETWEYREADLDLRSCRASGILVLGTNEAVPPLDMYPYSGFLALKLLFDLGLEGHKSRVVLAGSGRGLAGEIWSLLTRAGVHVDWFSAINADARPYDELGAHVREQGSFVDAYLIAEHVHAGQIIGDDGYVTFESIRAANPAAAIGIVSGNVDAEALERSGLRRAPWKVRPFGYMSYAPWELGDRPVLELYAGGLKVGQAMAVARLRGLDLDAATAYALAHSPAMPFEGEP